MAGRRASPARRYAEAAFQIAERDGNVGQWLAQLGDLAQAVAGPSVVRRLEDPNIPLDDRLAALRSTLGDDAVPQLVNMARLLLRRRRADEIRGVYREFKRLYNRQAGIVEASATSAVELDDQE
ncbi:MAG TPA: ATP synthase F1 subunit delta, partial [Candidatus Limnocylindrales bacterium]|nr:ATP synthase F1 subunit delta [Candidatus Limnocylindrales bacterium]